MAGLVEGLWSGLADRWMQLVARGTGNACCAWQQVVPQRRATKRQYGMVIAVEGNEQRLQELARRYITSDRWFGNGTCKVYGAWLWAAPVRNSSTEKR